MHSLPCHDAGTQKPNIELDLDYLITDINNVTSKSSKTGVTHKNKTFYRKVNNLKWCEGSHKRITTIWSAKHHMAVKSIIFCHIVLLLLMASEAGIVSLITVILSLKSPLSTTLTTTLTTGFIPHTGRHASVTTCKCINRNLHPGSVPQVALIQPYLRLWSSPSLIDGVNSLPFVDLLLRLDSGSN